MTLTSIYLINWAANDGLSCKILQFNSWISLLPSFIWIHAIQTPMCAGHFRFIPKSKLVHRLFDYHQMWLIFNITICHNGIRVKQGRYWWLIHLELIWVVPCYIINWFGGVSTARRWCWYIGKTHLRLFLVAPGPIIVNWRQQLWGIHL